MSLHLTPEMLAAAYDFLRTTRPFKGWRLPSSEEVAFKVTRDRNEYGHYQLRDAHTVALSSSLISQVGTLLFYLAHEMVHLKQEIDKRVTAGTVHNADFRAKAKLVCRIHGWDYKSFV